MTNFEKFQELEISGIRLFAHMGKSEALGVMQLIFCADCPIDEKCTDAKDCDVRQLRWLSEEAHA